MKERVKDAVERGGIRERGGLREKRDGSVDVRETATGMVCIRLVSFKIWLHFWFLMNKKLISCTSGLISLSMAFFLI